MFLWHVGVTTLIVRYVFRDPAMDLRWLAVGSILPDVIDKPIGSILFNGTFHTHRVYGHTLLFPVAAMILALIVTRRGSTARKAAFAVIIGSFVHLVLDGAWTSPEGFLWPVFGWTFPPVSGSDFPTLVKAMITDPLVWAGEAFGAAYLVYLWRRHLAGVGALRRFLGDGQIPMPAGPAGR
ncbi:MAG TPA: metal-dependent hydrolase [Acidimicrobiia bacterium]